MSDGYSYEEVAAEIVEEFGQDHSFEQRFIGFCENAMNNKAEDTDLRRLIENIDLPEEELDES